MFQRSMRHQGEFLSLSKPPAYCKVDNGAVSAGTCSRYLVNNTIFNCTCVFSRKIKDILAMSVVNLMLFIPLVDNDYFIIIH
jgi:hypothetical protein